MNATDAIRYLLHEQTRCNALAASPDRPQARRDMIEAVFLLLPALGRSLGLAAMDDFEAIAFQHDLRAALKSDADSYKVDGTCVECQRVVPLSIALFVEGQAREWCKQCGGERVFLLKTLPASAEVPA